jgi:hypothetical protein
MPASGMLRHVVLYKLTDVSEVLSSSSGQWVRTSETSVTGYETTGRNIPEGDHLHTLRRENLKSDSFWSLKQKVLIITTRF